MFSPLMPIKGEGCISFENDKLGEIWYLLNLHAEENPQKRLTLLKAELGKTDFHKIILRNPSG